MAGTTTRRARTVKAPDDRRRDLLDAGLRVLREKQAAATVADITRAAGVAKGTFYLYFSSKDDLVTALREQLDAEFLERITGGVDLDEPDDWWRLADRVVAGFVDFLIEIQDAHDAIYHGVAGGASGDIAILADFLRGGAEAGAFSVADPEVCAGLLFSAVHGAVDIAIVGGEVDRDRIVAAATDLVHRALRG
jgi:AcrR family transcriptional regulator